VTSVKDWNDTPAFLKKEELPDGVTISLSVVSNEQHRGRQEACTLSGGTGLDKNLLASLVLPAGMRAPHLHQP